MTRREAVLGDYIRIKHGFAFKGEYFSEAGSHILLTPGNCYERGGLRLKGDKEKYYTGDIPDDYVLKTGDLIVVMTDLVNTAPILGGAFLIPEDDKYLHNQRLGLVEIREGAELDKQFLYYALNSEPYRGQVRGSASGATVRHTAPERIYRCRVSLPGLSEQKEISASLKFYDDLIANNKRRIELLEQAARLLFKEWFVHLRYPGHEHDNAVEGVPTGWQRKTVEDVARLIYGKALQEEKRESGEVRVYGSSGEVGRHNARLVEGPGIVVGRKGNVGSVFWVDDDFWPIDTVYYVSPEQVSQFVLHLLKSQSYQNSDAAVPGLKRDSAHAIKLLWPSEAWRMRFEEMAGLVYAQRRLLIRANARLTQARDLLLPRLMDGRLAV